MSRVDPPSSILKPSDVEPTDDNVVKDVSEERRLVIRLVIQALWRSRVWIIALTFVGLIYGLYDGLRRPNVYLSQAKLLLRLGEREQMTGESLLGTSVSRESRPTIEDEIHMLYDEDVFMRVVKHVGPARLLEIEDPRSSDGPNTSPIVKAMHTVQAALMGAGNTANSGRYSEDQLAVLATDALMKDTFIMAEDNSNVITVRTVSTSPGKARYVAGLLMEAFIDRHREQFSLDRYLPTYRSKRDEARITYDEAREKLADHVAETGFIDLATQRELLLTSIAETNQSVAAARAQVEALEQERTLTQTTIDERRSSMSSTTYAELRDRLQVLEIEIPTSRVGVTTQEAELERLGGELARLEESAKVQDVLGSEVERRGRLFRELSERLSKIEALAQIDVDGDTNLMPLQLPTLPLTKEGPKRAKLIVFGGAGGFALGIFIAVLRYLVDRRLRFPEQLERDYEVPVLAIAPTLEGADRPTQTASLERAA